MPPLDLNKFKATAPVAGAAPLDISKFKIADQAPVTPEAPADTRNVAQKALGVFLDPIIETGVRTGQAAGALLLKGANIVSGGELEKYAKGGQGLDAAMAAYLAKPVKAPITGTEIAPASTETAKDVLGRSAQTIAGGLNPVAAGALYFGGAAARDQGIVPVGEKGSATNIAVNTVAGALGAKIAEVPFRMVAPYIEKAAMKYGQPLIEAVSKYVPSNVAAELEKIAARVPGTPTLPGFASKGIAMGKEGVDYAFNAPFAAAGKAATTLKGGLQRKAVDNLENKYYEWAGATKPGVKRIGKAEAAALAKNKAGTMGEAPPRVLAEARIVPNTEGTKFSTQGQADDLRKSLAPLHEANQNALKEISYATPPADITDLERAALSKAAATRATESERQTLLQNIRKEFRLLRNKYGDTISIVDLGNEKSVYWGPVKFDATKPFKKDMNYNIASAMQKKIETIASDAGFTDVAQLNRTIGDQLGAAKFLEDLNGQTLKHGRLGKLVYQGIGAIAGNTLIPGMGTIYGAVGGDVVARMLMSSSVSNPAKRLILSSIEKKSPEVYQATLKWLAQQGIARDLRLALPVGIQRLGPGVRPDTSSVRSVPAKKTFGLDKSTGQFKRVYTSEPAITGEKAGMRVSDMATAIKAPQTGKVGQKGGVYRYSEKATSDIGKLDEFGVIDKMRNLSVKNFSNGGKINLDAFGEWTDLITKAEKTGAKLSATDINRAREILKLVGTVPKGR